MELKIIDPNDIIPNPSQPRKVFDKEEISDLASNIKKHGLIQPIIVTESDGKYMIIAGERRWRAHKSINHKIPCIVKQYTNKADIDRDSLVENELRTELEPDELFSYSFQLAKEMGSPYYDAEKDWVNVARLCEYITGTPTEKCSLEKCKGRHSIIEHAPFYQKLLKVYSLRWKLREHKTSEKVKKAIEDKVITESTANRILSADWDVKAQEAVIDIARAKEPKDVKAQIEIKSAQFLADKMKKEHNNRLYMDKESRKKQEGISKREFIVKYENRLQESIEGISWTQTIIKNTNKEKIISLLDNSDKIQLAKKTERFIMVLEAALGAANSILGNLRGIKQKKIASRRK